jgi:uncharacterized protein (TIGR02246 family)
MHFLLISGSSGLEDLDHVSEKQARSPTMLPGTRDVKPEIPSGNHRSFETSWRTVVYFRSVRTLSTLSVTLLLLTSCNSAPQKRDTHDADVRTIKDGELLWVRHWSTRDADRIVSHYAEDAIWMGPHFPFANGREAIREIVKQLVQDANLSVTFEATRVDTARGGEFGYSQGTYSMTLTDPVTKKEVTDDGYFIRIYRRSLDGSWRAVQEINTSSPTQTPVIR